MERCCYSLWSCGSDTKQASKKVLIKSCAPSCVREKVCVYIYGGIYRGNYWYHDHHYINNNILLLLLPGLSNRHTHTHTPTATGKASIINLPTLGRGGGGSCGGYVSFVVFSSILPSPLWGKGCGCLDRQVHSFGALGSLL